MADKTQKLVLSIVDFLQQSISDGTVKHEDAEGIEVAVQCIAEAFGIDPADAAVRERLSVKPATLSSIFEVYLKTKDKVAGSQSQASSSQPPIPDSAQKVAPSAEDKAAAEKFKQSGNSFMSQKQYPQAVQAYTDAISLDPANPVYYSNRAAAHSSLDDHYAAIEDAQRALQVDPDFVKAYSRAGHAHFCLGDFESAADQYKKGLSLDPSNANLKSGLENSSAKLAASASLNTSDSTRPTSQPSGLPDLSALLGGGAGGGMPDMGSLLNNPALMQMAQGMMANGGLERMMGNPAVRNMMDRVQSGGGLPSMQEIMSDPSLRDLASTFGGGAPPPGNV